MISDAPTSVKFHVTLGSKWPATICADNSADANSIDMVTFKAMKSDNVE